MKFDYAKIREFPPLVRAFTFNHEAWLVGGAAKWIVGLQPDLRDWDIIVPVRNWTDAQHLIPYQTMSNTFGGFKIEVEGQPDIDVWAEDLDHFLATCTKGDNVIAVQPRKQLIVKLS